MKKLTEREQKAVGQGHGFLRVDMVKLKTETDLPKVVSRALKAMRAFFVRNRTLKHMWHSHEGSKSCLLSALLQQRYAASL